MNMVVLSLFSCTPTFKQQQQKHDQQNRANKLLLVYFTAIPVQLSSGTPYFLCIVSCPTSLATRSFRHADIIPVSVPVYELHQLEGLELQKHSTKELLNNLLFRHLDFLPC